MGPILSKAAVMHQSAGTGVALPLLQEALMPDWKASMSATCWPGNVLMEFSSHTWVISTGACLRIVGDPAFDFQHHL